MPVIANPERGSTSRRSTPRRTGLFIVVAALHVLIVYGLMVATGVVKPTRVRAHRSKPCSFLKRRRPSPNRRSKIKPEIEQPVAVDEPVPEVQFEEAVAPPSDVPVPASANAIAARSSKARRRRISRRRIASTRPIRRPRVARVSRARCA